MAIRKFASSLGKRQMTNEAGIARVLGGPGSCSSGHGRGALRGRTGTSWTTWSRTWRPSPWKRPACLFSLPIRKSEVDFLLKDEALKTMPVQRADEGWASVQVKAFGDYNGHIGLGVRCSKEVATAIQKATIISAKLSTLPVWRGYWRNKTDKRHSSMQGNRWLCLCVGTSLPCLHGHLYCACSCAQEAIAGGQPVLITVTISQGLPCHPWQLCWGHPNTYSYLAPSLWKETVITKSPFQEFSDKLVKTHKRIFIQKTQAPVVATTSFFLCFFEICSPSCPETCSAHQAGFEFRDPPAPASWVPSFSVSYK